MDFKALFFALFLINYMKCGNSLYNMLRCKKETKRREIIAKVHHKFLTCFSYAFCMLY